MWILYLRDTEAWQFANVREIKKNKTVNEGVGPVFRYQAFSFTFYSLWKARCQTISTRRMVKNIFTLARGKAWISLTGFTERPIPSTFCSNNSFSTGHKCRTSKVNIRLSIDGFRDRERFYRRRTRTCRLLPVFSVFNGPSACPDLRCSSFSRAAKLPSLVERREGKRKREKDSVLRAFLRVVFLRVRRSFRAKSRRSQRAFPVTSVYHPM